MIVKAYYPDSTRIQFKIRLNHDYLTKHKITSKKVTLKINGYSVASIITYTKRINSNNTITTEGVITIPIEIATRLKLKNGQDINVEIIDNDYKL